MMKYKEWEEKALDYLENRLLGAEKIEFEKALAANPKWREELDAAAAMDQKLENWPEADIPENSRQKQYSFDLSPTEKNAAGEKHLAIPLRQIYRFAYAAGFILFGYIVGSMGLFSGAQQSGDTISSLQTEVREMRQMISLSMLKQQSPSGRLQGIRFTSQVKDPDEQLVNTILRLLKTDANTNVRLAAVESLYLFKDYPQVKSSLLEALQTENSPLVQVAIIDLLVEIKEGKAIEALKKILTRKNLNKAVKEKAKEGIQKLS